MKIGGYGAQGAKPSRKSSSAPPCASVGWSTFLAVLPFINVRHSGRLEAQDEGLKSVIHPDSGYCGSRKLATARRQNHLVLAALLYTRASSSCHLVKLPVSPLMFLLSFSGVFCIRDLWISGKVSPCLRSMSLELTVFFVMCWTRDGVMWFPGLLILEFHWSAWQYWSERPRFRASWLVLSRIRTRYQVDTYLRVQSTVSSHVLKSRCGQLRKALSVVI